MAATVLIDLNVLKQRFEISNNKTTNYLIKKDDLLFGIAAQDQNYYILYPTHSPLSSTNVDVTVSRKTKKFVISLCKMNIRVFYSDFHDSLEIYDIEILYPDKQTLSILNFSLLNVVYFLSFDHRDDQIQIPLQKENSAVCNFEQLYVYSQYKILRKLYEGGRNILDYSFCHKMFIPNELHLPYQYSEKEISLLKQLMKQPKTYQVAMICNGTPHRITIWKELEKRGITVNHITGWSVARDTEVAKCQILLNVHVDVEQEGYIIFEELRCVRWMFAGMPIISESSKDDDCMSDMHLTGIEFVPYEELIEKVISKLAELKKLEDHDDDNEILEKENKLKQCAKERRDKLEIVLKKFDII